LVCFALSRSASVCLGLPRSASFCLGLCGLSQTASLSCTTNAHLSPQVIHLWDIEAKEPRLLHTYTGHHQSRFAIRSCFGGSNETFVVSGSEGWFWFELLPARAAVRL